MTDLHTQVSLSPEPLPWQRAQWEAVERQWLAGRLPHALLVAGVAGVGKTAFVQSLVAGVLCQSQPGLLACGGCEACQQVRAGSYGDLRWVAPPEGKRAIGIDQIRAVVEFLQRTAGYGTQRVVVIAPAEAMTTNAANALLKTLEEPTAGALLVLISHQPWLLPITARSRCQQLVFPVPSATAQQAWLIGQGMDNHQAQQLIALAGERPMLALALADDNARGDFQARWDVWQRLLSGEWSPARGADALRGVDLDPALSSLQRLLERRVRELGPMNVAKQRYLIVLHRLVSQLLARMARGATPARDVLLDVMCRVAAGTATPEDTDGLTEVMAVLGIDANPR